MYCMITVVGVISESQDRLVVKRSTASLHNDTVVRCKMKLHLPSWAGQSGTRVLQP